MIRVFLSCLFLLGFSAMGFSQIGEVKNDTIYVKHDVNKPVEFSKAIGKYLYILDIIPDDIPPSSRKIEIISSKSAEIDPKLIQVINNKHILIPIELFLEKYYTLYIKKGNATILNKKLIIR